MLAFFLITVLFSCDQGEYKGKYVFELYTDSVTIDADGEEVWIKFRANGKWEIKDIPDWLEIDLLEGEYSGGVMLSAKKNEGEESRKASLSFVYGNDIKTLEVEQVSWKNLPSFIKIDPATLYNSYIPWKATLKVSSNTSWHIKDIPSWISVNPTAGDGSAKITIEFPENRSFNDRKAIITFVGKDVKEILPVAQEGLRDFPRNPVLPITPTFSYEFLPAGPDKNYYKISRKELFMVPGLEKKAYLGNLLNPNLKSHTDISEFSGYTFNEAKVSVQQLSPEQLWRIYTPSLSEQSALAKELIEQNVSWEGSLVEDKEGREYFDRRQLSCIGVINLGVKLDEVVYGNSYKQQEMTKKYGLLLSFKRTLFTLKVDSSVRLIKENLKETDRREGVSYVSSVCYGKVGLLIIESDIDSRKIQKVVDKILNNLPVSQEETELLNFADICYVYFDNDNRVQTLKGNMQAVQVYKEAMNDVRNNIYPIEFQLSDFDTHSLIEPVFLVTL